MDEIQILKDSGILDTFIYNPPQPAEPDPDNPVLPVEMLGALGFTLEALSYFGNSSSEGESQRFVAGFAMQDLVDNNIAEASSFSLTAGACTYNFTVNRIHDLCDGWADVYFDFVSRAC